MKFCNIVCCLVLFFCSYLQPFAQSECNEPPSNDSQRTGKLANGFSYFIDNTGAVTGRIDVKYIVKVGGENEIPHQIDLAHLLEHIVAGGTRSHPNLERFFATRGILLGRDFVAHTAPKYTEYHISVPDDRINILEDVLLVVKEWAGGKLNNNTDRVNAERSALLQEKGNWEGPRITPDVIASSEVIGINNHNGRMLLNAASVREYGRSEIEEFYTKWYIPSKSAIVISGNIDVEHVFRKVNKMFSGLRMNDRGGGEYKAVSGPAFDGGSNLIVSCDPNGGNRSEFLLKLPFNRIASFPSLKEFLVNNLLADMVHSRLESIYGNRYDVIFSRTYSLNGLPFSVFNVKFNCSYDSTRHYYVNLMSEVYRILRDGFCNEEFVLAVERLRMYFGKDVANYNSLLSGYTTSFMYDEWNVYSKGFRNVINCAIDNIKMQEVNEQLNFAVNKSDQDFIMVVPDTAIAAAYSKQSIEDWTLAAKEIDIVKYVFRSKTKHVIPDLIDENPISAVKGATEDSNLRKTEISSGIGEITLANGVKVVLKPVKGSGRLSVRMVRKFPIGSLMFTDSLVAAYSGALVIGGGLGPFDREGWKAFLKSRDVKFRAMTDPAGVTILSESSGDELKTVLQAIYLAFTAPKLDTTFFADWKELTIDELKGLRTERSPISLYYNLVMKETGLPGNFFIKEEDIHNLTIEAVSRMYRRLFVNDGSLVLAVCGDYDTVEVRNLVSKYIGAIPVNGKSENVDYVDAGRSNCVLVKESVVGDSDVAAKINIAFPGGVGYNDVSVSLNLLKEVLKKNLYNRLRFEGGLSYSSHTYTQSRPRCIENKTLVGVSFDCDGDRVDEVIALVKKELLNLKKRRNPKTLRLVKESMIAEFYQKIRQPSYWADRIVKSTLLKGEVEDIMGDVKIINDVKPHHIRKLASTFNTNEYRLLSLLPERNTR